MTDTKLVCLTALICTTAIVTEWSIQGDANRALRRSEFILRHPQLFQQPTPIEPSIEIPSKQKL